MECIRQSFDDPSASLRQVGSSSSKGRRYGLPPAGGHFSVKLESSVLLRLRGLCCLQSEPLLDRLAHQELLNLAGDGHREFVDEFDIARDLVVRDLALAEAADFVVGEGFAGPDLDPGAEFLAVPVVGD